MSNKKVMLTDLSKRTNHTNQSAIKDSHPARTKIQNGPKIGSLIIEIVEYEPKSIQTKTVISKSEGNINVSTYNIDEELETKTSPFNNFIQIIAGEVELELDKKNHKLKNGESIFIPANTSFRFKSENSFKMVCSIVKN